MSIMPERTVVKCVSPVQVVKIDHSGESGTDVSTETIDVGTELFFESSGFKMPENTSIAILKIIGNEKIMYYAPLEDIERCFRSV